MSAWDHVSLPRAPSAASTLELAASDWGEPASPLGGWVAERTLLFSRPGGGTSSAVQHSGWLLKAYDGGVTGGPARQWRRRFVWLTGGAAAASSSLLVPSRLPLTRSLIHTLHPSIMACSGPAVLHGRPRGRGGALPAAGPHPRSRAAAGLRPQAGRHAHRGPPGGQAGACGSMHTLHAGQRPA